MSAARVSALLPVEYSGQPTRRVPLIFTTTGGMGDAATQFYKRLANLLSAKQQSFLWNSAVAEEVVDMRGGAGLTQTYCYSLVR